MIPKAIREMFDIQAEDTMIFRVEKDEIVIRKEDGAEIIKKLLSLFPDKLPEPENIDWDELHYSQFEDDLKKYKEYELRDDDAISRC